MTKKITLERLQELLDYDPATGIFLWKISGQGRQPGSRAGTTVRQGHRVIIADWGSYSAHSLAWLMIYGVWPRRLKYIDGNKDNCAISNLEMVAPVIANHDGNYMAAYRKATASQIRDKQLQRDFGITLGMYNKMLDDQGGVCAICEKPEFSKRSGKIRALAVDHCHDTGRVRALLCTSCNPMIGYSKDDTNILRKAAAYLERHRALVSKKEDA